MCRKISPNSRAEGAWVTQIGLKSGLKPLTQDLTMREHSILCFRKSPKFLFSPSGDPTYMPDKSNLRYHTRIADTAFGH